MYHDRLRLHRMLWFTYKQLSIVILLILCSVHLFKSTALGYSTSIAIDAVSFLFMMSICIFKPTQATYKGAFYTYPVFLFCVGIGLSIVTTYMTRGQGPFHTFVAYHSYYFILLYFVFRNYLPSLKNVEIAICILGILYICLHFMQYVLYPNELFITKFIEDRGSLRFKIEGGALLSVFHLFSLNKYMVNKRLIYLFMYILSLVVILMQGYRTLLLAYLICALLMSILITKFNGKSLLRIITVLVSLFIVVATSAFLLNILNEMAKSTEYDFGIGSINIRLEALRFYFGSYMREWYYFVIGGGMPNSESKYGDYIWKCNEMGLYWEDIGFLGFYCVNGLVVSAGYLWIMIRSVRLKCRKEFLYAKFFMIYLLLCSLTTMEMFRNGVFGVVALSMYILERSNLGCDDGR